MNLSLEPIAVPLRDDGRGGLRVGDTRVGFESVWHLHCQGASPGEIVQAFDTLQLQDVMAVLAWAIGHPREVNEYLERRVQKAADLRRELEQAGSTPTREESVKIKERLMAKWHERQRQRTDNAALSDG